ncbi:WG repeat-containing protein [Sutcliffiella deserti]|uniref:WG repeat-containing protein n=1 Tax=Sutcliffiella deserti TaxID=2875501 RepID=UPI001CBDD194|nr:WG repeat-containing protein [Sutcliffiella deserti]
MLKRIVKPHLYPASIKTVEGTVWGYINESGEFVIPPRYEDASEFQENGLAIVRKKGTGLIKRNGRFAVPPIYSSISPFTDGRAVVLTEQGFKVINEKGKVLTEKAYPFISSYKENRAVFQETDQNGNIVYGYLDLKGRAVIPAQYKYAFDYNEGKALVQLKEGLYALIDMNGLQLQTFPYEQMNGLSEELLSYKKTFQEKSGYVDEQGKVVISPRFAMALPFDNGRAVVTISEANREKYGLIDKTGSYIIQPKYNDIHLLGENRAAVGKPINVEEPYLGSLFAIADTETGPLLTDFLFSQVNDYDGAYSSVTQGETSFFINKKGKPATNLPIIQGIGTLSLEGKLIKALIDQRLAYYSRNGRTVWTQNTTIPLTTFLSIHELKYMPNKDYLVYYPQLKGMQSKSAEKRVNQLLKKESQVKEVPSDVQLDYSYSGDFSIKFFQKNLLELELVGYHFPYGAAHGMPSQIEVPIDLKTGKIYSLKDLFKPDSNYVKILSEIIEKQIQNQPEGYYFPEAYKGIRPDQPFYVMNDYLVIYFQPYEIAAFAAGFPTFKIPYSEIMEIINVNGEFWRSFH